jgi:hypothetical protein
VRNAGRYQAKWTDADLDGAQWQIPKNRTGAEMDISPAPILVDWYREFQTLAGDSGDVLPAHSRSQVACQHGDTHLNKDKPGVAIDHWLRTATVPVPREFTSMPSPEESFITRSACA